MFKNWKTTLGGLVAGLPIGINAVINAYAAGELNGQSGSQLFLAIGIILLGAYSKDHNVTGGSISQTKEQPK